MWQRTVKTASVRCLLMISGKKKPDANAGFLGDVKVRVPCAAYSISVHADENNR